MGWCCWVNFGVGLFCSGIQYALLCTIIFGGLILLPVFILVRRKFAAQKARQKVINGKYTVGLFHPYCNAGGGGERVLWGGLQALAERYPNYRFIIYTGDVGVTRDQFLTKVKSSFNITFPKDASIEFVHLTQRKWVEASRYPYFTLLGQSLGSMWLGYEALSKFVPDVFIDTMGYAFTYPASKYLAKCKVGSYTHYPTISTDMLSVISSRTESFNNASAVVKSPLLSNAKLIYYKLFAWLYSTMGRYSCDVIMTNSSWTYGHISSLWKCPHKLHKVYPPCNVEEFRSISRSTSSSNIKILSIAQFRPEKNYPLQLESLAELKKIVTPEIWSKVQLVCIGSCRDSDDQARVDSLKKLAVDLEIDENVQFKINVPFNELKRDMSEGLIGIHTMWNEHFGIGIVESMAAGLIMVANNSGGPMMDIVNSSPDSNRTGFLASTKQEYAKCIKEIIEMSSQEKVAIIERARASVDRFSDAEFSSKFLESLQPILRS